ncbi:MAG: ABC transporter substrate-binding protein [Syntrophomonadaceae bacterium]|nr:ABC transporter substrate-binding protein [Syntrophomonadaceae bacterium]
MYLDLKKTAMVCSLLGLILIISIIIHMHHMAVYTASLATRPLNAGLLAKVNTLEPAQLSNHQERLIASTLYEGLVIYDEESGKLKPGLASKWKYSADAKLLTIDLKHDVLFHNGKKLTARDVKAAWERNFAMAREWSSLGLFLSITGSTECLEGKTADIAGIKIVGDHSIHISFKKPNTTFISMLCNPLFWVYDYDEKAKSLSGTGPFILKDNKENKNFMLLRNEKYHRGLPRLSSINFQIYDEEARAFDDYKAGKLDYLDYVPLSEVKNIRKNAAYKDLYIERPLWGTYSLAFNLNKEPFAGNYLLRRALNYAIDRNAIIENVFGGAYLPAKGVIPIELEGYSKNMLGYSYKPEKARQLLEQAGYSNEKPLKPLILTYNTGEGHRMVAEAVAEQLAKLGIQVQLQVQEWDYYKGQLPKMSMSFFRLGWQADYPDADSFLFSLFHSSKLGISNYSGYNNPQLDKILDQSRTPGKSPEDRIKLINRAEEIVVDDAPYLWLFQKKAGKLIGKEVSSFEIDGMEMIDWYKVELFKPSVDKEIDASLLVL